MKANKIESGRGPRGPLVVAAIVLVAVLVAAALVGFGKLRDIYLEQCVITDMASHVSITSGKMVKADVLAENLGLRVGANLALIDFERKREEALRRIPTLRSISISRRLPDKVVVAAEERTPIAKMGLKGKRGLTGRVVDVDGVVFPCMRGTLLLPTIIEPQAPGTAIGHELSGRARAALRLLVMCREPKFMELGVQDVDISRPDYLLATISSNYAKVKIAWEGMDGDPSPQADSDLEWRLSKLLEVIRSGAAGPVRLWNATMPDRIFADPERTN